MFVKRETELRITRQRDCQAPIHTWANTTSCLISLYTVLYVIGRSAKGFGQGFLCSFIPIIISHVYLCGDDHIVKIVRKILEIDIRKYPSQY